MTTNLLTRIVATDSALALLSSLREKYGPLQFFLSGDSRDNNSLLCYALGGSLSINADIYMGNIDGTPFYMCHEQYEFWMNSQLIIDVINGAGTADSLDCNTGMHFMTRSRLLSEEEIKLLEQTDLAVTHRVD